MTRWPVIFADDFTGAGELAGMPIRFGLPVIVVTDPISSAPGYVVLQLEVSQAATLVVKHGSYPWPGAAWRNTSGFSENLAPDEHAVMLWDGAGFHRGKELFMPANITAIQLPAYRPEFNPIENPWQYLKNDHWSNQAYQDVGELEEVMIQAWRDSVLDVGLIKSVCSAKIHDHAVI